MRKSLGQIGFTDVKGNQGLTDVLTNVKLFQCGHLGQSIIHMSGNMGPMAFEPEIADFRPALDGISIEYTDIVAIPPQIFTVTTLVQLRLQHNAIKSIPNEIDLLVNLVKFILTDNHLVTVPAQLGRMLLLRDLDISWNYISWLPSTIFRPGIQLAPSAYNRLLSPLDSLHNIAEHTADQLRVFRYEFTEAAIGLQDLELPALVTLEILDALCPNAVRMAAKWDLIVAVKHFRRAEK